MVETEMKRRKKKGRPSLLDLEKQKNNKNKNNLNNDININNIKNNKNINIHNNGKRTLISGENYDLAPARRSTRRNPTSGFEDGGGGGGEEEEDDDDDDDDDERKEKKVKLVVRLPESNLKEDSEQSGSEDSDGDVDLGGEGHVSPSRKKRKTNGVDRRSDGAGSDQGEKLPKPMDTRHGLPLEPGPATLLPEKKLLIFILDRLQKKDTYGVFSEPVDPDDLPDYHEIIKHPMDFGTVRKKLEGGLYQNLEELEADVLLICSNAMQYNAPDTVYFRQARTIQELAKRDFANLRHEGDDGEPQPKVVRRGRPPSKNLKKPLEESPVDHRGPELASGATLASGEDKAVTSNSHTVRKTPTLPKIRSSDAFVTPSRPRNGESYTEWSIDWSEFPANIVRADMKHGKKNFTDLDETKRDTYIDYHPSGFDNELMTLYNIDGDMKRLMAVGLHFERHAYARSLVTFAANLGPVAWKIASRKVESVLPAGVKFGPGWVGENDTHPELLSQKSPIGSSRPVTPSAPGIMSTLQSRFSEEMAEAARRLNTQGSPFQAHQQKPLPHPNRNGLNGVFGYNMVRPSKPPGQPISEEGPTPHQRLGTTPDRPGSAEPKILESWGGGTDPEAVVSSKAASVQHRQSLPVPPDLNVKFRPPGSPSSSTLPIGSPKQPDLALQL